MHYFMMLHKNTFAWEVLEQAHFWEDFFLPIDMPVLPHMPWVEWNFPIPPGIYNQVFKIIKEKIDFGIFKTSNSSYCTWWYSVVKKDRQSLRPVLCLEALNLITIWHSGVPPFTEQLAEQFARQACGSMLDLYIGYDKQALAESSRDLTTFKTLFGAMQLTMLPMEWMNSVPIFHKDITYILQKEIPHITQPYIDDIPVRGPETRYLQENGEPETIPENPGIRWFVWENFQDLNRIVQHMKYCGGTYSRYKSTLCAAGITILGHHCTFNGWLADQSQIVNWGPCKTLSDIWSFLGMIGVCQLFIKNFTHRVHHLIKLTRKGANWEFGARSARHHGPPEAGPTHVPSTQAHQLQIKHTSDLICQHLTYRSWLYSLSGQLGEPSSLISLMIWIYYAQQTRILLLTTETRVI